MSIANDTRQETKLLERVFGLPKPKYQVLDCCCGVGRHAFALANAGCIVKGIDFSESQINNAQLIHNHSNVTYEVMDIRHINIQESFDAAICMWTTYNYLSLQNELRMFIEGVWNSLVDGGILVLDSKNIPALEAKRVYHRVSCSDDGTEISLIISKDIYENTQNSLYMYFVVDSKNKKRFYYDYEHVRFYNANELQEIVGDLFEITKIYGDFDGAEYDENSSERFITILRKRAK